MRTKFFIKNNKDKIEFTEKELKELLDEIYNEGYQDGKIRNYFYTTPTYPGTTLTYPTIPLDPYKITCDNSNIADISKGLRISTEEINK